jgi:hypothetical protein
MMKAFGYALMVLSAVSASVFASPIPFMKWPFVASCLALAVSMIILRKKPVALGNGEAAIVVGRDTYDFRGAVDTVLGTLESLRNRPERPSLKEIHSELDRLIEIELFDFAENRDELLHLGYGPYARVVSTFSRAERMLNRCWSASVDGYDEESYASLELAQVLFKELKEEMAGFLDKD